MKGPGFEMVLTHYERPLIVWEMKYHILLFLVLPLC